MPSFAQKANFTLRVGYYLNYGVFEDKSGHLYGYVCDYMNDIAAINGWDVEFIKCEWVQGQEKLERGELDVFGCMQKTPERMERFDFPDYSMGSEYGTLSVKKGNTEIFADDLKTINGKTVGVDEDNFYKASLDKFCSKNNISLNYKIINSSELSSKALQSGEIDMRLSGSMMMPDNSSTVLHFTSEDFYFPTTKGNTYVLDGLNSALATLKDKYIYYNANLYEKYYGKSAVNVTAFTEAEQKYIENAPVLNVGYDMHCEPVEYYDKQKGTESGINLDLLKEIAVFSGLRLNFVEVDTLEQTIQMLESGELAFTSGIVTDTPSREENNMIISAPLTSSKLAFISKQGVNIRNDDIIVAVPYEWIGISELVKSKYNMQNIVFYESYNKCLDAVLKDEANVAVLTEYAASTELKPYKYNELVITNLADNTIDFCIGTSKNEPRELAAVLDKSINALSTEVIDNAVYRYTIGTPYKISISDLFRYNSPFIIASLMVVFGFIYFYMFRARKNLDKLAFTDELTGEMSLSKFKIEAQKLMHHGKTPHAVIVLDIDNFKIVNSLYGYDFGDKVLVRLCQIMKDTLAPDSLLCRGTADKFYMFIKYNGERQSQERFAKFSKRIEVIDINGDKSCKITVSAGIYVIRTEDTSIVSVIDKANIASKVRKTSHNNTCIYYNQSMYDKISLAKELEDGMKEAVINREFLVFLQPKIELNSSRVVGAEALARWQHPVKGFMSPNDFIPLFEENGFIVNLDYYVFEETCKTVSRWVSEGKDKIIVSVNLSRRHLENPDTPRLLHEIAEKYNTPTKHIEIELTESAFVDCDIEIIQGFLNRFHEYGFTISVDDFGAGYSSLSMLKDLPLDVVKIDKSFFNNSANKKAEIILESIINLSHKLNIKTVSEGVETKQQVELLQGLGCDLIQGFYFARPMPLEQMEQYISMKNR